MALDSPAQTADYPQTDRPDSPASPLRSLYMAIELSAKQWKIAFSDGGTKDRVQTLERHADRLCLRADLEKMIGRLKRRFGLPDDAQVFSCMEAGRDGFWPHRFVEAMGIHNVVVDPASMRVNRRSRRAKTDRLDARQLLADLVRYHAGDRKVWSVIRIPTPQQEDDRRLHRELEAAKEERTKQGQRIGSILATMGGTTASPATVLRKLDSLTQWDGSPLPLGVREQLERAATRYQLVHKQILEMQKVQRKAMENPVTPELKAVDRLTWLAGIGLDSAWLLEFEFFAWRKFKNRRQVAGAVGLCGTPYNTGSSTREQGISKAGNPMVRTRMIELAWLWLRYQPDHKLSRWFQEKFAGGGSRRKRAGIVAVARRLLIELWHFAEHGVVPAGVRGRVA